MKFITTPELAELLRTSEQVIRQSRVTGILFGRPSPVYKKLGVKKILYQIKVIEKWIDDIEDRSVP